MSILARLKDRPMPAASKKIATIYTSPNVFDGVRVVKSDAAKARMALGKKTLANIKKRDVK